MQPTGAERRPTPGLRRNHISPSAQRDDTVKSPSQSPPPISQYTSPHDAVLARMRGWPTPVGGIRVDAKNHPESLQADGQPQAAESVDAPSPSSVTHCSTANNPAGPREVLYDPFDGSPLGLLAAESRGRQSQQGRLKDDDLWVHLSRVLDLQNQVAKMHLEMESVRPNDGKGKAAGRGQSSRRTAKGEAGGGNHSDKVADGIDVRIEDAHEGDEEGVEVEGDEEAERKKAREAEFAGLADHFEGRNESINAIMGRVSQYSFSTYGLR